VVDWLDGPEATGAGHGELEARLQVHSREQYRLLLQGHLDERARREARRHGVTGSDGLSRPRVENGHHRELTSVFGPVTVTRKAYRAVPGAAVGDQIIPQAADQERPLGDDVRAADGTTFAVNYRPARRSLDAAVHQTATSRCCRGGLRPPCRRPRWSPPGVTRDRRTFGGCPATTELIQPPGRGPAE
jgi:hypothetical protein